VRAVHSTRSGRRAFGRAALSSRGAGSAFKGGPALTERQTNLPSLDLIRGLGIEDAGGTCWGRSEQGTRASRFCPRCVVADLKCAPGAPRLGAAVLPYGEMRRRQMIRLPRLRRAKGVGRRSGLERPESVPVHSAMTRAIQPNRDRSVAPMVQGRPARQYLSSRIHSGVRANCRSGPADCRRACCRPEEANRREVHDIPQYCADPIRPVRNGPTSAPPRGCASGRRASSNRPRWCAVGQRSAALISAFRFVISAGAPAGAHLDVLMLQSAGPLGSLGRAPETSRCFLLPLRANFRGRRHDKQQTPDSRFR